MEKGKIRKKLVGDRDFYKLVLGIALPIMIQNGISNFVGLLDNLMIGRVGTESVSGVAISNQLIFVYYLLVFGASAGVGIFTAQYHGTRDTQGIRYSFRAKLMINMVITLIAVTVLYFRGGFFIAKFLEAEARDRGVLYLVSKASVTYSIGLSYLRIMLIGLFANAVTHAYAGTLRETGETRVPMYASFAAVFVNLAGNYLLIYGHLGLPELGADGAAIATVISRFLELAILVIYTHRNADRHPFIKGALKSLYIPGGLFGKFLIKAMPLMLNEGLWSLGCTMLNQSYSYRSFDAVAAVSIETTIWNLLGVAFLAMGDAVGIIVGQILGTGDMKKARDYAVKLTAFTVFCGSIFAILMALVSPFFPMLYNTTDPIRILATKLILLNALFMPVGSYLHATYFIIRSGGRTGITMVFDSCFMMLVSVPLAYFLSRFTSVSVILMMACVLSVDILKSIVGFVMVRTGIWMRRIVR